MLYILYILFRNCGGAWSQNGSLPRVWAPAFVNILLIWDFVYLCTLYIYFFGTVARLAAKSRDGPDVHLLFFLGPLPRVWAQDFSTLIYIYILLTYTFYFNLRTFYCMLYVQALHCLYLY